MKTIAMPHGSRSAVTGLLWSPTPGSACCGSWPLTGLTGLTGQVSAVLADTYRGCPWLHDPGRMYTDLAVAVQ